jgi:hypothetical protein
MYTWARFPFLDVDHFEAPKALSVMRSLGRRANSVQLRVGDPFVENAVEPVLTRVS